MKVKNIFLGFILTAQTSFAVTLYVDSKADGAGDGTSWADAFTNVQEALANAASGDEIWIAQGTYYPDEGPGQTDNSRASSFKLVEGVRILGGFSGDELSAGDRNPDNYTTIFSGDLMQNDGPDFTNYGDNAYHVILSEEGITQATIIDGIQITAGNADLNGVFPDQSGGGAYIFASAPAFIDCTFIGNTSEFGGAVLNDGASSTFTDCHFENNTSLFGGAIYNYNDSDEDNTSGPVFTGVTVTGNNAERGGGIYNSLSAPQIINSIFRGNTSDLGGAAVDANTATAEYVNCIFQGNSANLGGAIYGESESQTRFINCSLQGNLARDAGGAVFNDFGATPIFTNCIIWTNAVGEETSVASASYFINGTAASFNFSLVENWSIEDLGGNGNFDGTEPLNDPRFVDPIDPLIVPSLDGDLNLQEGTPVSGAGDNDANDQPFDLAGNPRIQNGVIDLGPFETEFSTTFETRYPALGEEEDANENGLSNFVEYALGLEPTAENAITDYGQIIDGAQLSYKVRAGVDDIFVDFEKSSNLSDWFNMVEGDDYTLTSETISGSQMTVTVELLSFGTQPVLFFRQMYEKAGAATSSIVSE